MSATYTLMLTLAYLDARFLAFEATFMLAASSLVLLAGPGFLLHYLFLRRLRSSHIATWELLGRPTVVFYGSFGTGLAVMRFIRNAEYEALGDASLASVCRVYRTYSYVYSGIFVAMLAAFSLIMLGRY